jgi:molecular chaperone HscB
MATESKSNTAFPIVGGPDALTHTCWSCGEMRAAHFCDACGHLQPAVPTDYFTFFGLPRKLNIDVAGLEREFHKLSRKLHPDLYVRAQGPEQAWSLEKSSQLNDANRTLRDPISRTEYLLKIEGVQLEEQSKAATDQARATGAEKKQVVPPDLLEEVFELNMQLEELRAGKKMGEVEDSLKAELQQKKNDFEQKLAETDAELRKLWAQWDKVIDEAGQPGAAVPQDRARAKVRDAMVALLNRRKYVANLVRDVNSELES